MDRTAVLANLRGAEGLRLKPYRDTKGKTTIGYGRNLDDHGISKQEAELMLGNDLSAACADLDRNVPEWRAWPLPAGNAIAEMAFNLGWPRLSGFTQMLTACRDQDWKQAAAEALDSLWADETDGRKDGRPGDRALRIAGMFRAAAST